MRFNVVECQGLYSCSKAKRKLVPTSTLEQTSFDSFNPTSSCIQIGFYYQVRCDFYFYYSLLWTCLYVLLPVSLLFFVLFEKLDRALIEAECLFYLNCNQRVSCSPSNRQFLTEGHGSRPISGETRGSLTTWKHDVDRSVAAVQVSSAVHYLACRRSWILPIPPITPEFTLDFRLKLPISRELRLS